MKILASWYSEDNSPNKTIALLGSEVCPDCHNTCNKESEYNHCDRCGSDGYLTNQMRYCSELMECAAAPTWMKENGIRLGDVLRVKPVYQSTKDVPVNELGITVRLTDFMADRMYTEKGRGIDLNKAVFARLTALEVGVIEVEVEVVK